jgi:hypothetical protein
MRLLATIILIFSLISFSSIAYAGTSTLNYETYRTYSYAPNLENPYYDSLGGYNSSGSNSSPAYLGCSTSSCASPSVLSSGTISSLNTNWGSGTVLDSGRSDNVAVKITGYIQHPGTAGVTSTVYFAGRTDDGFILNIDGTNVITDWQEQSPGYWNNTGTWSGVGGQWYPITMWWYENGGGAVLDLHYSTTCSNYSTTCMVDIPSSLMSTTNVVSITSSQTSTLNTAIAKTNTGNLVYIEQTGSGTTIDINQDGTGNFIVDTDWSGAAILNGDNQVLNVDQITNNNGLALGMVGNNIDVTVAQGTSGTNGGHKAIIDIDAASNVVGLSQYDGGTLSQHFALIDVDGASNTINISQRDNGQKVLFMDVDIISGTIDILQKDTGTHYLELNLTGSASHDVDIMQQGTGDHAARVTLGGGYATDFDLLQQGSTDQSYELNSTCSNALGCSVQVTQGN